MNEKRDWTTKNIKKVLDKASLDAAVSDYKKYSDPTSLTAAFREKNQAIEESEEARVLIADIIDGNKKSKNGRPVKKQKAIRDLEIVSALRFLRKERGMQIDTTSRNNACVLVGDKFAKSEFTIFGIWTRHNALENSLKEEEINDRVWREKWDLLFVNTNN